MGIDKSYENVTVDIEDNYYFAGADAVQTSQTRSSYDYELPLVFEPLVKKLRSRTLNFLDFYPFKDPIKTHMSSNSNFIWQKVRKAKPNTELSAFLRHKSSLLQIYHSCKKLSM